MTRRHLAAFAIVALLVATSASAATIVIVNKDPAGVGFNDATSAVPVGGNTGTTLGQQRLNAFQAAAIIWGVKLNSPITIRIAARFGALTPCTTSSGVLGSAGPTDFLQNFPNAPRSNTWFPIALASARANVDYPTTMGKADAAAISAQFNSNIGTAGCLPGLNWYLGLDGNENPATQLDLLAVLLHEFGHGLGFSGVVNLADGSLPSNTPDIFSVYTVDTASLLHWNAMSNAQRAFSATNTGFVLWDGPNVMAASSILSLGNDANRPRLFAPSPRQPGSSIYHWDTVSTPNQLMEPFINSDLTHNVDVPSDLTMKQMLDIGWQAQSTNCYTLATAVNPTGVGASVTVNSAQNCTGGHLENSNVTMTANAPAGYVFSNWTTSGGGTFSSASANPTTFTITGNASVTANFSAGSTSELVVNGGFEQTVATGNTTPGWTVTPTDGFLRIQQGGAYPHAGTAYAYLGGDDDTHDYLRQTISIPSNATSATLTFWVNVVTDEAIGAGEYDALWVDFYQTGGAFVDDLAFITNEDAPSSSNTNGVYFQVGPINVLPFKGQTLQLVFETLTDETLPTTFRVDDITLQVQTSGSAAPTGLVAIPLSPTSVFLAWDPVAGASFQVLRKSHNGAFTIVGTPGGNSFSDPTASANTSYLYQVKAVFGGTPGPPSNNALATTIFFTDDPLSAFSTRLRAVHIQELRTAVNAMRSLAGLTATTFTDTMAAGVIARGYHVTELRTALDAARSTLGLSALSYTDPTLTVGSTKVKKVHVEELRDGVE